MSHQRRFNVFGIAGYSGSGKTTLIEGVLPRFRARGMTVSVIKHTHHGFDLDRPGKDSWRQRQAGAQEVMLAGSQRWALMCELQPGEAEPTLPALLARLAPCDLVLVEGYKREAIPKLEVHRAELGVDWLYPHDQHILAVASDVAPPSPISWMDLNDLERLAQFIESNSGDIPC